MARHSRWCRLRCPVLATLVGTLGCFAAPITEPTAITSSFAIERSAEPSLGPGDVLRIVVLGHPELSTSGNGTEVSFAGEVSLPLIGDILVRGQSQEAARRDIEQRFKEYVRNPSVTLSISQHGSQRVHVLGHVESPGEYVLEGPRNALQALSMSGRFLDGADRANVAIVRSLENGELDVHVFNAASPGPDGLVRIRAGDLMFIRQTGAGTFAEQARPVITTLSSAASASMNVWSTVDRLVLSSGNG